MRSRLSHLLGLGLVLGVLSSCETTTTGPGGEKLDRATAQLRSQAKAEHTFYRSLAGWKKNTYRNKALLEQATPENVSLQISLREQRGYLLVRGALAMDFPVATGKASHPTPSGSYRIMAMEKDYASNLYGRIVGPDGAVLVSDADSRQDAVPSGAKFVGSSMPYWMRLTDTGVGLHVGYIPGVPASHGCIRLKTDTAKELFSLVRIGTPVTISPEAAVMAEPVKKT